MGLLPGMNGIALLPSGESAQGGIVPETAVVRWQGKAWIYVETHAGAFARREITADFRGSEAGYLESGIANGARVVVAGAQTLLSEELRAAIQVGEAQENE